MPSGKVHTKITYITCLPIATIIWYLFGPLISLIVLVSYIFAGQMFNGDLDIKSGPYNRWGLLKFIWHPYQKTFKHRSFYTHGPIVGTAIRLGWVLAPLSLLLLIFDGGLLYLFLQNYLIEVYAFIIGLELGAMSHSLADWAL